MQTLLPYFFWASFAGSLAGAVRALRTAARETGGAAAFQAIADTLPNLTADERDVLQQVADDVRASAADRRTGGWFLLAATVVSVAGVALVTL